MTGTANAANRSSERTKALVNAAKFAAAWPRILVVYEISSGA